MYFTSILICPALHQFIFLFFTLKSYTLCGAAISNFQFHLFFMLVPIHVSFVRLPYENRRFCVHVYNCICSASWTAVEFEAWKPSTTVYIPFFFAWNWRCGWARAPTKSFFVRHQTPHTDFWISYKFKCSFFKKSVLSFHRTWISLRRIYVR